MRKIVGLMIMSVLMVSCSNAQEETSEAQESSSDGQIITLVGKAEFKALMENDAAQLVDVRSPEEVAKGKIGDATNINYFDADFKEQLSALDKSKPVLVYCASGRRSANTVIILKDMGFSEIHDLAGGYGAWMQ